MANKTITYIIISGNHERTFCFLWFGRDFVCAEMFVGQIYSIIELRIKFR